MPPLNAADLEDLDNLDPDDFDEGMDTAENRGDTVDPNAETEDGTDDTTEDDETVAGAEDANDDTDESGEDDGPDSGESSGDDEADAGDEAEEVADEEAGEETDEGEAEANDVEETTLAAEAEETSDDPRIPKSRFDSVNARRKEAERKLAELQAQIETTGESGQRADRVSEIQQELGELDDQINDAILDADATKLKQLRTRERELNNEALQFQLRNATSQAAAEAKYDALLDKVETDYPEYNPDSEVYNEEMVSETLRLQKALISNGSSKDDALVEAIDLIRPRYVNQEAEQTKTTLRDKPKRDTKTNTKRNKKVAKAQPAATASRSSKLESTEDIDFDNLSQPEDIDKFDEKTLARLSGDLVD